jgi:SET domain-containing protein
MANPTTDAKPSIDKRYACFRLQIKPSRIHRWGVYAVESIPARRKVIEYTGEKIDLAEFKRREETLYLFELDSEWTIDGSVGGSGAEFVNHSCEPNLETRILKGHILYFSLRPIKKGEELTIDYNYDDDDELMICGCGAKTCRGTINIKD